ncbi:hypothetical protein BKD02_00770 [Brucella sp. 09RB8910]|nr:hypothetical protein BKD02_00770 [Brucella sp. 09RB8910]
METIIERPRANGSVAYLAQISLKKTVKSFIVKFGQQLAEGRTPQTVGNWMSHLASIFTLVRPAWGFHSIQTP